MSTVGLNLQDTGGDSLPSPQACPICGAKESFPFICPTVLATAQPIYALVECSGCHVRFLHPSPSAEALHQFYAPHYFGADWYRQEEKGKMFAQKMLRPGFGERFLDVGCNLGHFLHAIAHTSGWEVYGVEISPEAVAYAREHLLLDVRCGELTDANYPDQFFSFIRISNVLEHVRNPVDFLKECRRILRPGGQLYLSVPNGLVDSAGLVNYFQCEKKPPRSKDGHLFFFPKDALNRIFNDTGFEIVSAYTYGIRRGLRALGRYPQKSHWKNPYRLPDKISEQKGIILTPRPKRLPGYAAYRFWQFRLKRLSGMVDFGLDYEIFLTAV